jgi:hypothetical protein
MNDQNKNEVLLNDFVDDLNAGAPPRIWAYLEEHPEEAELLIPTLNIIGALKATTIQIAEADKEAIRKRILQKVKGK